VSVVVVGATPPVPAAVRVSVEVVAWGLLLPPQPLTVISIAAASKMRVTAPKRLRLIQRGAHSIAPAQVSMLKKTLLCLSSIAVFAAVCTVTTTCDDVVAGVRFKGDGVTLQTSPAGAPVQVYVTVPV
jgi:hypothetical protein